MTSLNSIYTYPALKLMYDKHKEFEQNNTTIFDNPIKDNDTLIGIEVEVENIKERPILHYYWNETEDGSLRNYGVEYTSIPLTGNQIPYALSYLKIKLEENNVPSFSQRTSIHIHLNVRNYSWERIKSLLTLYAIFEKHFFNLAGSKREENIFCVPLYKCMQLTVINNLEAYVKEWSKYSAINLGTIIGTEACKCFGTIEFRHLYGTLDIPIILFWINSIIKLHIASDIYNFNTLKETILTLNTTSEYIQLYKNIFEETALVNLVSKHDFESCITTTKIALFKETINLKYSVKPDSNFREKLTHFCTHF